MKGRYVGHILVVSKLGIETDPEKTNIILNWFIPATTGEVRTFLSIIKIDIARPLSEVMLPSVCQKVFCSSPFQNVSSFLA